MYAPKIAMRKSEAEAERAGSATESLARLQRELEVLRSEDKERTASTKRLEALLTEQKNDNASVRDELYKNRSSRKTDSE